jgi:hypothetical protein
MKRILTISLLVLILTIVALATGGMFGCAGPPQEAERAPGWGVFYLMRDAEHDLCFAVIRASHSFRSGVGLERVPCELVPKEKVR